VSDPDEIRRLGLQISQGRLADSAAVLGSLRNQPMLLWNTAQLPQLLQVMETHE
jgi:hypothetical protein